jgi:dGTPase
MEEIAAEIGLIPNGPGSWFRHPLVFLMEAADDICYAIVDLEDAFEVGILEFNQVESILLGGLTAEETAQYTTIDNKDSFRKLGYLRGKVVDFLVRQVIDAFMGNETPILEGEFSLDLISRCNEAAVEIVKSAKRLAQERVFVNTRKLQIEIGAYSTIDVLFRSFCDAYIEHKEGRASLKSMHLYALLGVSAPKANEELYPALIRVADFVSGCTDKYAAVLSQRLGGIAF